MHQGLIFSNHSHSSITDFNVAAVKNKTARQERNSMNDNKSEIGTIGWIDLTVDDASGIRDFYSSVVGWSFESHSMGDYNDYVMKSDNNLPVAGICHKLGFNSNLPSKWLIYITVKNLDESLNQVNNFGGKIIDEIRNYAEMGKYCVIEDPAGAVLVLFEKY